MVPVKNHWIARSREYKRVIRSCWALCFLFPKISVFWKQRDATSSQCARNSVDRRAAQSQHFTRVWAALPRAEKLQLGGARRCFFGTHQAAVTYSFKLGFESRKIAQSAKIERRSLVASPHNSVFFFHLYSHHPSPASEGLLWPQVQGIRLPTDCNGVIRSDSFPSLDTLVQFFHIWTDN